jgi:hypothetical protein
MQRVLALTSALIVALSASSPPLCSGNGVQSAPGAPCTCDFGWLPPDCSALSLGPVNASEGRNVPGSSSWGGSVLHDPAGGLYHMYYARFEAGCGLALWSNNSVCVHATSLTPAGPYQDQSTVLPVFCHGPKAALAPDGTIVLYHIGHADDPASRVCNCTAAGGSEAACVPLPPPKLTDPQDGRGYVTYATAAPGNWDGPFTPLGRAVLQPEGRWEGWLSNPSAPLYAADGSYFLAYRSWGAPNRSSSSSTTTSSSGIPMTEYILIARAAALGSPLVRVRALPIGEGEDPSLYFDPRGGLHMLSHQVCGHGHSYSPPGDPTQWTTMPHAVGCNVSWVNGTSSLVHRRERPQLLWDAGGRPLVLLSGVQPLPSAVTDACFTMAQRVVAAASAAAV